ncbi:MAG: lipoate--protein ligase [Defluviitaleaceae bacterium]|nr:lipoate--protein ligase [Defluviitaleaceae bacterium]
MLIFEHGGRDPYLNLAIEDALADSLAEDCFLTWRVEPSLVIGRYQDIFAEVDLPEARRLGVPVVRRRSGGGAVYNDGETLFYTFIVNYHGKRLEFGEYTEIAAEALRRVGVPALAGGRNDISADGRKISGCAAFVSGEKAVVHGTLLFGCDTGRLAALLRPSPLKLAAKGVPSVRGRVGEIKDFLAPGTTIDDFRREFCDEMRRALGSPPVCAPDEELMRAADAIAAARYRDSQWLYVRGKPDGVRAEARFPGGTVVVWLRAAGSVITDLSIYGDFFSKNGVDAVEKALIGVKCQETDIANALGRLDLEQYIEGVGAEELAGLLGQCLAHQQ